MPNPPIQRLPAYPDVPSLAEYVKDYDYGASFGILAPLGTPQDAVIKLSDAIKQATESQDFIDRFKGQATVIRWTSPRDYLKYLRENQTKFDPRRRIALPGLYRRTARRKSGKIN